MHAIGVAKATITIALASSCLACTSGPQIRVDGDPSVNVAHYKTFGFFEHLSIDQARYSSIIGQRLKDATRRELQRRGYQEADSAPELLVNFNTNIENRSEVHGTSSGFYGYRAGMYGSWAGYPQEVYTTHYQQGTLAIDVVDAAKQQLVWQAVAQARLTEEMLNNPTQTIDSVVTDIFAKYPVTPLDPAQ